MAHHAIKDQGQQAVLITGIPGTGFQSIASEINAFYTDIIGYRTSHLKPTEWIVSIPILRFKITEPNLDNPFFIGFGQNYIEMCELPWKLVILLVIDDDALIRNVKAYRESEKINDGKTSEEVAKSLLSLQKTMIRHLERFNFVHVINISYDDSIYDVKTRILKKFESGV